MGTINDTPPRVPDYEVILRSAIFASYHQFCKKMNLIDGSDIRIDFFIVDRIIVRCIRDFARIKQHHGIQSVDAHKVSGYLTYWMSELLPIIVENPQLYTETVNHYLNHIVAVFTSLSLINAEKCQRDRQGIQGNNVLLSPFDLRPMFKDFLYTLKYCPLNPDLLSMIYFYIDCTAGRINDLSNGV